MEFRENFQSRFFCPKMLSEKNLSSCVAAIIPIDYCELIQDSPKNNSLSFQSQPFLHRTLGIAEKIFLCDQHKQAQA